ncbi:DUF2306 domain-containing protein [Actinokineospora xionganensis]|uniref:DUF2306 domain-containing protein n=1 Tax=Actinokineospora xionganensis TaxID=2684470 RepID=A0ABR7LE17_9PSEU|nr:DUF2306 domain-containing protein [Actinokineospora xionganensis]MBC6450900.1 DUF2306 domain-containing protein [Actinokineospora xionganensis]
MTQEMERIAPALPTDTAGERPGRTIPRAPWMIPMALLVIGFLIYQLPPWAALDPTRSRIPLQNPAHYWLIVGHVFTGTISLVTGVLQVWPRLRITRPKAHRWIGRAYVFLGAVPSGILALVMLPVAYPVGKIGVAMSASLWTGAAILGWVKLRQRRYAAHRQLMLYSIAIMWGQVIWGFMIGMPFVLGWIPGQINFALVIEAARWVGWTGNIVLLGWWLNRTRGRRIGGLAGVKA